MYISVSAVTPDNFPFFVQRSEDVRKALAKIPAEKPIKTQGSDGFPYPTIKPHPTPNHYTWESKTDDMAYTETSLANFAHGTTVFPFSFTILHQQPFICSPDNGHNPRHGT